MLKGNINYNKELLKAQKQALYNPKTKFFASMAVCLLITFIAYSFALFEYNSDISIAYRAKINKYVTVDVTANNATVSETGTNSSKTVSSKVLYNTKKIYYFSPNDEYIFDEAICTNNQTASYDSTKNTLTISPKDDTVCTVNFVKMPLSYKILADNPVSESPPETFATTETSAPINTLFPMQDDDGTSYYFRGLVTSNYVSFADILWRIVRVNGDGTVRLVTDNSIGASTFNKATDDHKYVGYTYDNSHICTKANPCYGTEGTASTIKTYLDEWYNTNLKSYEDKIVTGNYCNDTTYTGNTNRTYGAENRLSPDMNPTPTLKCPDTSVNYGGNYKLKIGLLSADELALTGVTGYPYSDTFVRWDPWSFSPSSSIQTRAFVTSIYGRTHNFISAVDERNSVQAVINLKADALTTSGDGTESNPYVVE